MKTPCLRRVRAVPRHCTLYGGIQLATEGKAPVRVVEKCQLGTIHYVDMATIRQVVPTSLSTPVSLGAFGRPGPTLGQRRNWSSCQTNGFPIPANLESDLWVQI